MLSDLRIHTLRHWKVAPSDAVVEQGLFSLPVFSKTEKFMNG